MPSRIRNITADSADPWAIARFWAAALDLPVHPDNEPGDDEVGVALDAARPNDGELIFQRVPEPKTVKNRFHLCLEPSTTREDEVARLLGLGAVVVHDRTLPDGTGWVVMGDPDGNEFCVLRSAAERSASGQA